jgi:hypothetical protein
MTSSVAVLEIRYVREFILHMVAECVVPFAYHMFVNA